MQYEFEILKVPNIILYKFSKLTRLLKKIPLGYPRSCMNLATQQTPSTHATQEISNKFTVREREKNDRLTTTQVSTITKLKTKYLRTTETHSRLKKAFYK